MSHLALVPRETLPRPFSRGFTLDKTVFTRFERVLGVLPRKGRAPSTALPTLELRDDTDPDPSIQPTSANDPPARACARKLIHRLRPGSHSRTLAREALILSLKTLKESTPAFPPLQSAAGGVLELITCHETMTRNKADRQKLYSRAATIHDDLEDAKRYFDSQPDPLSDKYRTVRSSMEAFELSLQSVIRDMDTWIAGESRVKRFILARDHKSQIEDLYSRLSEAESDFRRALEVETNLRVIGIHGIALDTKQCVDRLHALGLDTNSRVGAVQSTTTAHLDIVQSQLQVLTTTVAHLQRDTRDHLNSVQEMTFVQHRIDQSELYTVKSDIITIHLSKSVGLFAVACS